MTAISIVTGTPPRMSLYLDHYLESVESLPTDLQRNFTLMRELDSQAHCEWVMNSWSAVVRMFTFTVLFLP